MDRRSVLKILSAATAGGLMVPAFSLKACQEAKYLPKWFSEAEMRMINEIGEVILPETEESIGAKSLKVANYMDTYVADCILPKFQAQLRNSLAEWDASCEEMWGATFAEVSQEQKTALLTSLDQEARQANEPHSFALLRSMVLFSYFTSEEVSTKVLRYVPIPGKYIGDFPLEEGDTLWAI